jgi:hypothetical protein
MSPQHQPDELNAEERLRMWLEVYRGVSHGDVVEPVTENDRVARTVAQPPREQ